jgi:hypothetical protein
MQFFDACVPSACYLNLVFSGDGVLAQNEVR